MDVITDVKLGVKNTQYTKSKRAVLSSHFQIIQAGDFKEQYKNQTIQTKTEKSCTTIEYVAVTMYMCQNILLTRFKVEQPGPTYYL